MLYVNSAVLTDVGLVRSNNEDNFYLCGRFREQVGLPSCGYTHSAPAAGSLFAVCDGMGGISCGETASLIAAETLARFSSELDCSFDKYLRTANSLICKRAQDLGQRRIGTTLAALYIDGRDMASICSVGDSRIYLLRRGRLKQLSTDHTQAELLIKQGLLRRSEAALHQSRHVLTQHLGIPSDEMLIEPDIRCPFALRDGDIFLLCSDGLTDMLGDDEIASLLQADGSAGETARRLIDAALLRGGRDNVTALTAIISETGTSRRRVFFSGSSAPKHRQQR